MDCAGRKEIEWKLLCLQFSYVASKGFHFGIGQKMVMWMELQTSESMNYEFRSLLSIGGEA